MSFIKSHRFIKLFNIPLTLDHLMTPDTLEHDTMATIKVSGPTSLDLPLPLPHLLEPEFYIYSNAHATDSKLEGPERKFPLNRANATNLKGGAKLKSRGPRLFTPFTAALTTCFAKE